MSERGSITLWVLGLSIAILFVGGLSVDLWRVMSDRRELSAVADSAAAAAASALDTDYWRDEGLIRLDPAIAEDLAKRVITSHRVISDLAAPAQISVQADEARVVLVKRVDLTLLRIFMTGSEPLTIRVASTARAVPSF